MVLLCIETSCSSKNFHILMRGDLMRRCCLVFVMMVLLSGCVYQKDDNINTVHPYFLEANSISKNYVSLLEDNVYELHDEWELARLIQMRYEAGSEETYFKCDEALDLNKTSDYLTHVYPFDIKLVLHQETYMDANQQTTIYQRIAITNMDPFYEDTMDFVKQSSSQFISDSMNTSEKIEAIHDYLIQHVTYDKQQLISKDLNSNVFFAYGALLDKKAVCTGYARAFMMYARILEIPCIFVTSKQIDHAWNMIYDGQTWRYVDATWDDQDNGKIMDVYRNKEKKEFYADGRHVLDKEEPDAFYKRIGLVFFGY